jgi:dethiobiotin synthase
MAKHFLKKPLLFVTGTDTGVGKTMVSALLLSACRQAGLDARYWKPIQTGTESDFQAVKESVTKTYDPGPQPIYQFAEPMAPLRAAELCGEKISISTIVKRWSDFEEGPWIIEGAGGLLVPLARPQVTIKSLAVALNAPILIVASSRLGTMNHTLLTLESARSAGLKVLAIAWTGSEDPGLSTFFSSWRDDFPPQIQIPWLNAPFDSDVFEREALRAFPAGLVKRWFDACAT